MGEQRSSEILTIWILLKVLFYFEELMAVILWMSCQTIFSNQKSQMLYLQRRSRPPAEILCCSAHFSSRGVYSVACGWLCHQKGALQCWADHANQNLGPVGCASSLQLPMHSYPNKTKHTVTLSTWDVPFLPLLSTVCLCLTIS